MAAETAGSSTGSADSYIGSLISLTSKSEIRYEGILFNINTEESSIGLRNVRSFGTEGRKTDGPQVAASDKIYEYILFRGRDIKDLQVKSSPPVQTPASIHNDPAIIQSHYPQAATSSRTMPLGTGSVSGLSSQTQQMEHQNPAFISSFPLYPPGGSLGSWVPSAPPPTSVSGFTTPLYWSGVYGSSNGFQAQQQSLLQPPPALSVPPMHQTMQYPAFSVSSATTAFAFPASQLSDLSSPLLPSFSSDIQNLQSSMLPVQPSAVVSDSSTILISDKDSALALPNTNSITSVALISPFTSSTIDKSSNPLPVADKSKIVSTPTISFGSTSETGSSAVGISSSIINEGSSPTLITPSQLLQPEPPTVSSSQILSSARRDVEVVQISSVEGRAQTSAAAEKQEPILPLPSPSDRKLYEARSYNYRGSRGYNYLDSRGYNYHDSRGGRGRGSGNRILRPVTRFTEEFDFTAMNEKFNKDEVWGDLGKSNKVQEDGGDSQDDNNIGSLNNDIKVQPGYVKDDFFDSLSCDALDHGSRNGRTKFSEQLRKDTETFGYSPRNRGGRGGRGYGPGGRSRGGYYGRGYANGYGYAGRGRGT